MTIPSSSLGTKTCGTIFWGYTRMSCDLHFRPDPADPVQTPWAGSGTGSNGYERSRAVRFAKSADLREFFVRIGSVTGDGPGRIRTCDLGIKSPLLYQLSYRPLVY
jgi:hypothetical protein